MSQVPDNVGAFLFFYDNSEVIFFISQEKHNYFVTTHEDCKVHVSGEIWNILATPYFI